MSAWLPFCWLATGEPAHNTAGLHPRESAARPHSRPPAQRPARPPAAHEHELLPLAISARAGYQFLQIINRPIAGETGYSINLDRWGGSQWHSALFVWKHGLFFMCHAERQTVKEEEEGSGGIGGCWRCGRAWL